LSVNQELFSTRKDFMTAAHHAIALPIFTIAPAIERDRPSSSSPYACLNSSNIGKRAIASLAQRNNLRSPYCLSSAGERRSLHISPMTALAPQHLLCGSFALGRRGADMVECGSKSTTPLATTGKPHTFRNKCFSIIEWSVFYG
jgi:hypothetical protein